MNIITLSPRSSLFKALMCMYLSGDMPNSIAYDIYRSLDQQERTSMAIDAIYYNAMLFKPKIFAK